MEESNELIVEWRGDASVAAKAIADHFKQEGWDAAWFQGGDTRRFRAIHVASGRDIQGRVIPPRRPKGLLGRVLPADSKCRVKVLITASPDERQQIEATIHRILSSVGGK